MKRFIQACIALFVLFHLLPGYAQKTYVGVKGGANFADLEITFEDEPSSNHDVQSKTLFGAGGIFGITLNKLFSIQLEPMVILKGGVYTEPSISDLNVKSSYLELPLLLKVGVGEKIRPYILAGPSIGFVLASKAETKMAGIVLEADMLDMLKRTEFGAVFGAGLSVPVWKGSVFIEGRYALGLTNMNKGGTLNFKVGNLVLPGPETVPGDEIKSMGIHIMMGDQLSLAGK